MPKSSTKQPQAERLELARAPTRSPPTSPIRTLSVISSEMLDGVDAAALERAADERHQPRVDELARRQVDGHGRRGGPTGGVGPAAGLPAGLLEHARADRAR